MIGAIRSLKWHLIMESSSPREDNSRGRIASCISLI